MNLNLHDPMLRQSNHYAIHQWLFLQLQVRRLGPAISNRDRVPHEHLNNNNNNIIIWREKIREIALYYIYFWYGIIFREIS